VAVVRALADQVEQLSRAADADGLGTQFVEELTRLGRRLLDAAALTEVSPVEESGVFPRAGLLEAAHWEIPTYELVRMDAEIGSYQEDDDPGREAPRAAVRPQGTVVAEEAAGTTASATPA